MAINPRLQILLDKSQVAYEVVPHRETFTAQDVAASAHVTLRKMAKVLVMRDNQNVDFMVVLPASHHFDDATLRRITGRSGIRLEDESEILRLFPDCAIGAMPPFGNLYGLRMYVDPCLAEEEDIWFQAGNHHELVHMRFEDFERVARPFSASACVHEELAASSG